MRAAKKEVLRIARHIYGPDRTDAELQKFDPNDVDEMDPGVFYELLCERFGIVGDDDDDDFEGFGGPLAKTIRFVAARWDGRTLNDIELPPTPWLEEYDKPRPGRNKASRDRWPPGLSSTGDRFFEIDTVGRVDDGTAFTTGSLWRPGRVVKGKRGPRSAEGVWEGPNVGDAIGEDYQPGWMVLDPRYCDEGAALESLLGNTSSLLLLSNDAAGVIADHCTQHLELLPFALHDAQRKRLLSEDYVVVNPLGIVAAGPRPPVERGIFRFGEPHRYAVSERLALALKRSRVTNVALLPLEA